MAEEISPSNKKIWEEILAEQNVEPVEPAMAAKKMSSNINNLYDGSLIDSWEDEEFVYINFPFVCINIHKDIIHDLGHDLANLAEILLETYPPSEEDDDGEDDFEEA